ncbi:TPMT [Branchiostoma lanceolatum]|uniref:thiopurine S-methyltransferase n=1 Tax=Branchiostoma lanceolatum TaxID=7740 RepID=A0A8K0ENQ8_BRALA|nr:TPMT [Branchiostoma lanceolatum]
MSWCITRSCYLVLTSRAITRRQICAGPTSLSLVPKFSVQSSLQWRGISTANLSMSPEDWNTRWTEGRIGFHRTEVNPYLKKFEDKMTRGRSKVKVFVPLCGKSVDMKWLADQDHTVVGVDCSVQAAEAFFKESSLIPTISDVTNLKRGKLFKSQDGRISLYVCDLYDFSSDVEGEFDAVWDRGALVAINSTDRKRYVDLILSLMKLSGCYLLDTLEYDQSKHAPPPHSIPPSGVQDIYGGKFDVRLLETADGLTERHKMEWGLSSLHEHLHLITPKLPEGKVVNKYGEVEKQHLTPEDWQVRWGKGHTGFHKSDVSGSLQTYIGELTGGRSEVRVLLPLCGKTLDIKWLLDQGHTVVGVEFAQQPVEELFQENNMTPTVSDVPGMPGGKLYQAGKLSVYCGDFFNFTSEIAGQFDAVWDKASLIAINVADRERYAASITSFLKPDGHYLLETLEYDQSQVNGPPYSVPGQVVEQLYGAKWTIQHLETGDGMTANARKWGLHWLTKNVQLLSLKP